jgi:signal peptidase I
MFKRKKKLKFLKSTWLKAIIIAFLIAWLLRTFFFELAIVPDIKMENTLFHGDVVFINKLKPGPRMPITLLSIPFFGYTFPFSSIPSYLDIIQFPYIRLKTWDIKCNDILAFNYPIENDPPVDKKTIVFMRCFGLPGDTIHIKDKKVFVNNVLFQEAKTIKYKYRISAKIPLDNAFFNKYQITEGELVAQPNIYDVHVTDEMADSIAKNNEIKKIQLLVIMNMPAFTVLFPESPYESWSLDYFGTLIIPKKGVTVLLNKNNIYYYKQIIEKYEGNTLSMNDDAQFFINGKTAHTYTFKMNYYFVLDDNRDNGKDSRYWGFLPENHIIGTAKFVLFNIGNAKKRFLKKI